MPKHISDYSLAALEQGLEEEFDVGGLDETIMVKRSDNEYISDYDRNDHPSGYTVIRYSRTMRPSTHLKWGVMSFGLFLPFSLAVDAAMRLGLGNHTHFFHTANGDELGTTKNEAIDRARDVGEELMRKEKYDEARSYFNIAYYLCNDSRERSFRERRDEAVGKAAEQERAEMERREREARERREREAREKEARERERKERDVRERREREARETEARERERREQEAEERRKREAREIKEWDAREEEAWERERMERVVRERREQEAEERREQEAIDRWKRERREEEAREKEAWERERKEREVRVTEARERERREQEAIDRWKRERREQEVREEEAWERERMERVVRERREREARVTEARERERREQEAEERRKRESRERREREAREEEAWERERMERVVRERRDREARESEAREREAREGREREATKVYQEAQALWSEAFSCEKSNLTAEAKEKFERSNKLFSAANNIMPNVLLYKNWYHISSLKLAGDSVFNEAVSLQEEGHLLRKKQKYEEALAKYNEALNKYEKGFKISRDTRFVACIEFVKCCIKEVNDIIEEGDLEERMRHIQVKSSRIEDKDVEYTNEEIILHQIRDS